MKVFCARGAPASTPWEPRILKTLIKPCENGQFYYQRLHQAIAGAKRATAPQPDPTRAPLQNHWNSLCFCMPSKKVALIVILHR